MDGVLNGIVALSWFKEKYPDKSYSGLRELCERTVSGKSTKLDPTEVMKSGGTWLITYEAVVRLYGEPQIKENE